MLERLKAFLLEYDLHDKTIVVGFSGGFDSMCLLDLLSKVKEQEGFWELTVIAAHFNHNWRGEESLKEQEICRLFATAKGFEFYTKTATIDLKKSENSARIARYEFFEDAIEEFDADAVFTAHNKDDNAETVLYRVIKGTGLYGLKGISQKRNCFYRPLLKTTRSEIVEYCEKNNLTPNFDSSNMDTAYRRNFIRLNVIPSLEKINPTVKESLNTLAEVARNEDAIINEYLSSLKEKVFDNEIILSQEFKKLSSPVKMRLLHEFMLNLDLDYDFKRIKEIYEFIEANLEKRNGSTISLTTTLWLYVDNKVIETIPRKKSLACQNVEKERVCVDKEGEFLFNGKKIILKRFVEEEIFVFPSSTANFAYVDLSNVEKPFYLRTREDGDLINPFGMSGTMKLKKYLNSKGVSKHNRDNITLLANDKEVLWVVGVGLSNKIGVVNKPTHVIEVI